MYNTIKKTSTPIQTSNTIQLTQLKPSQINNITNYSIQKHFNSLPSKNSSSNLQLFTEKQNTCKQLKTQVHFQIQENQKISKLYEKISTQNKQLKRLNDELSTQNKSLSQKIVSQNKQIINLKSLYYEVKQELKEERRKILDQNYMKIIQNNGKYDQLQEKQRPSQQFRYLFVEMERCKELEQQKTQRCDEIGKLEEKYAKALVSNDLDQENLLRTNLHLLKQLKYQKQHFDRETDNLTIHLEHQFARETHQQNTAHLKKCQHFEEDIAYLQKEITTKNQEIVRLINKSVKHQEHHAMEISFIENINKDLQRENQQIASKMKNQFKVQINELKICFEQQKKSLILKYSEECQMLNERTVTLRRILEHKNLEVRDILEEKDSLIRDLTNRKSNQESNAEYMKLKEATNDQHLAGKENQKHVLRESQLSSLKKYLKP